MKTNTNLIPFTSLTDPFFDFFSAPQRLWPELNQMKTDVKEFDDHFLIEAELPGFQKEEIRVHIEDDCLVIEAEHTEEKEKEKEKFICRERKMQSFARRFILNPGTTENDIECVYENGILKITVKKAEEKKEEKRLIEIK